MACAGRQQEGREDPGARPEADRHQSPEEVEAESSASEESSLDLENRDPRTASPPGI